MESQNNFITEEHSKKLPTVRIKKVVLDNFKNVGHGTVEFNCGKKFVPYGTKSDILGIYGQNGSGKTSFIESLEILKSLMSGHSVSDEFVDCIAVNKEFAELTFDFDLQYPDGKIREATYAFCLGKREATKEEISEKYKDASDDTKIPDNEIWVNIFNERLYLDWEDSKKKQVIIDTTSKVKETTNLSATPPFGPDSKRSLLAGGKKNVELLERIKKNASLNSKSFIFLSDTLSVFMDKKKQKEGKIFYEVLAELNHYAKYYLFVLPTKASGLIRLNLALTMYSRFGRLSFPTMDPFVVDNESFQELEKAIKNTSFVLKQLVPGLSIELEKISDTKTKSGKPAANVILVTRRDQSEFTIPIRSESDGIRRLISMLHLLVSAFNDKSITVAIDEFDAGIYEYLLGEILKALEDYGKGQFIFTSHNLRPLEVINRKFLCFTTTDPDERYCRLKNIASTNNLRDTYFREIMFNEQDQELYNPTKIQNIVAAIKDLKNED